MSYLDIFSKENVLIDKLGRDKAHIAWVMGHYLEESDIEALAASALTDGPDDKKIDFIHIDYDNKKIVFAQGYYSSKNNDAAPANKSSDLNTAAAWLFSGDIETIPSTMKAIIQEARDLIASDEIESIELFYIHNLPESVNVARELQTVEDHIRKIINGTSISVKASELGLHKIQYLHDSQQSHIDVKDQIDFPSTFAFEESGPNWRAYIASVPGRWLHQVYGKYGDSLFSANYRGFLGGGRRRRVNAGIRESAENKAADFWAFNNGITILTINVDKSNTSKPTLKGMSIINGAQTTGSIGSVDTSKRSIDKVRVLCRVIASADKDTIEAIVKFNNTQNAIRTWDQYSNDPEQTRLAQEFKELGFDYNIKRGFDGDGDRLSIDEVIQPLLSFHGRPQDAVRGKNAIFDRKQLYQNAFDGKKARHVLFVYSLSKAIDNKKLTLKQKSDQRELIAVESEQLSLMRNLRFKAFFVALMAQTIEPILGERCDALLVGFLPEAAKGHTLIELTAHWAPVVDTLLALVTATAEAKDFSAKLSDDQFLPGVAKQVNALLHAMNAREKHHKFSELTSGT